MTKFLFKITLLFLSILVSPLLWAQSTTGAGYLNQRTPEQEASKQTEKLQYELDLTPEQVKIIYQINLKYAQARKNTVSRVDAMEIIKNKDEDIKRALNDNQYRQLTSKRATRQQVEIDGNKQYLRTNTETMNFRSRSNDRQTTTTLRPMRSARRTNVNSNSENPLGRTETTKTFSRQTIRTNESNPSNRSSASSRTTDSRTSGRNSSNNSSSSQSGRR
ncbi:MAG: hypothetical protein ACK5L7_08575 [Paludibacteraceae bacterium]